MAPDTTITHRCHPHGECFCVYDPDCNPAVKAGVEARVDRVAACLQIEMGVWISAHPNAGLFDWDVLAREVLRVADTHPTSRERYREDMAAKAEGPDWPEHLPPPIA